jgi:hypothetical protein
MSSGNASRNTAEARPSSIQSARVASRLSLAEDLPEYLQEYARERPEIVALTCFAVGFILGWKLKPW